MEPSDAATETEVLEAIERYYVGWFTAESLTKLLSYDLKRRITKRYVEYVLEKIRRDGQLDAEGKWNRRCYRPKKNRIKN